jgi:hypothetical protein
MHACGDGTFERLEHRVIVPGTVVADPIHEERGCSRHPVLATVLDVALDARAYGLGVEVAFEAARIEAGRLCELEELGAPDGELVIEERVVHLEEAPSKRRGFGRPRREVGAGVRVLVRKMAEDVDHAIAERLTELAHHGAKAPTVGAKEILIADDEHRLVAPRAANVIALGVDGPEEPKLRCARVVRHGGWLRTTWNRIAKVLPAAWGVLREAEPSRAGADGGHHA